HRTNGKRGRASLSPFGATSGSSSPPRPSGRVGPAQGPRRRAAATGGGGRVFLDNGDDRTVDPGRIVSSQAQYLTSPVVLDQAVALTGHRLSRAELSNRLTVGAAKDAALIT